MQHLFGVARAFVIGAAVLVGIGLVITLSSTALELVAMR
jgi:hypothetical protein